MRIGVFFLFLFFFLTLLVSVHAQSICSSVSQYGITWTFDKGYRCGQFVNGDYWVLGPVTINSVSPGWDGTKNGSMLDPVPALSTNDPQGYDIRMDQAFYDWKYSDSVRVSFPTTITPGNAGAKSLVSTIGLATPQSGGAYVTLDTAAVLTVVTTIPAANSFRPPYVAGTKTIWNTTQVNYNLLPSLSTPSGTTLPNFTNWLSRVWLDHGPQVWGSAIHPQNNMPGYPADMSVQISDVALLAQMNIAQKTTMANRLIQLGIDEYAIALTNGDGFSANGGFGSGRKWPILFAGILLNSTAMKSPPATALSHVSGQPVAKFGEDGQTYVYNDSTLATTDPNGYPLKGVTGWFNAGISLWRISDDPQYHIEHQHKNPADWTEDGGGKTHTSPTGVVVPDPPSGSNSDYRSESYRQCCTVYTWVGQALAARLMNAESIWNHSAYFGNVDLWMQPKNPMYLSTVNQYATFPFSTDYQGSSQDNFVDAMWNAYNSTSPPPSVCGNGLVESGEVCDGGTQSCSVNGHVGTQSCNAQCVGYNSCVANPYCGDGTCNAGETPLTCTQDCPTTCTAACGEWSPCVDGSQSHTCTAANCSTSTETQSCSSGNTGGNTGGNNNNSGGGGSGGSGGGGGGGGSAGGNTGNGSGATTNTENSADSGSSGESQSSETVSSSSDAGSTLLNTCYNHVKDGEESGVDCGGLCASCTLDLSPDTSTLANSVVTFVVIAVLVVGAIVLLISLGA